MKSKERFLREVCGFKAFEVLPLKQDASSRKYWRVASNGGSYVLMDGDAKANKFLEFVELSRLLNSAGVYAPKVYFVDMEKGLMLLEDLGDGTFTTLLEKGAPEEKLYQLAVELLIKSVKIRNKPDYVNYLDEKRIVNDICFFVDWYFPMATGRALGEAARVEFAAIVAKLLPLGFQVPSSIVLWDYHVDNVMLLKDETCAVIDFQDALWGPVSYDIMSLLEDRRSVGQPVYEKMKERFFAALEGVERDSFENSFAFFSMFRNMRVLGRFSILLANGREGYNKYVPNLWKRLEQTLEHPKLVEMKAWVDKNLPPEQRAAPKKKPIKRAIILAAGRGTRMRELGNELPKPLIELNGKPLIDYKFAALKDAGIKDVVVNVCYQKEKIKEHLRRKTDFNILISEEEEALETGGGVKNALPLLGDEPFFTLNSDEIWQENGAKSSLRRMIDAWEDEKFDIMLLLAPLAQVREKGLKFGNYKILADGSLERNVHKTDGYDYFYPGVALVHPRVFEDSPEGKFSMRELYDKAQRARRLGYVILDEAVYHVGTPEDLNIAKNGG